MIGSLQEGSQAYCANATRSGCNLPVVQLITK